MATLAELTTPLTKAEIQQAIFDAIEARGVQTSSWKPGAIARTIIAAVALILSAFSTLQARIAESGFLLLSSGDWLTLVARHVYDVERNVGTFAAGNLKLDNTGGGVYVVAVGDSIAANSTTGKTYRNTEAFTLDAFETGKIVAYQAIEIGSDSSSAIAEIDTLETVLLGVTITNDAAFVGQDVETDADLQARATAKTGVLSPNGPSDAYRFLALSAETDDGTPAGVTRTTTTADGAGNVSVFVADAGGSLTGSVGDTTTPLGAVDESIQTQAVPLGVTATVASATPLSIAVTYEVWVRNTTGFTAPALAAVLATALTTFMGDQPIGGSRKIPGGGFVFVEAIEGLLVETIGSVHVIDIAVTVPAADAAVAGTEAPTIGAIGGTVNIVLI